MLCKRGISRHAVSVCVTVRPSRSWILSKRIIVSSNCFHHRIATPNGMANWQYSDGNLPPPNRGVECRWGRQKSRFWANIYLHCVLWTVPATSAIHLAATDHGEFITLIAGKRPSLLMEGNNDKVYDKKPQRYAKDNRTAHLTALSDKSLVKWSEVKW